jgi:ABC-type multidrug transport system fused ATPase/permease subunit
MHGRTSILISHRVAAVRRADQIAVLEAGRLVELGRHDALVARGGVYAELYRAQLGEEMAA